MLLIIDNYDSFVYNIFHRIDIPEEQIGIVRNDAASASEIVADSCIQAIILSPGPMGPDEAGISAELVLRAAERCLPILGICLGHQCICKAFGCTVGRHPVPTHGKASPIELLASPLFEGLPSTIGAGRYHSLHVERDRFNHGDLRIIAQSSDGTIMGVQHCRLPIYGVQFHPESVLTGDHGRRILNNFARIAGFVPAAEAKREIPARG